jgi:hypothetical protein
VPESVSLFLEGRGHDVTRLKDDLPTDSPDPLVAKYAQETDAILLTFDRDFRQIAPRVPKGTRTRFRKLSKVYMECEHKDAVGRLAAAITLIEFEWEESKKLSDPRMHVTVQKAGIKTHR